MLSLKYCPTCIEDTCINNHIIKSLHPYILKKTNNIIYNLYGDSGSGKSTIWKLILKELQFKYIEINYTLKNIKSVIEEKLYFIQNYSKKTILIIEDFEYSENDIINIFKTTKFEGIKIILVSSKQIDIKNIVIKADCTFIKNYKHYKTFINKVVKQEKIKKKNMDDHIKYYGNNIRECINNLIVNDKKDICNNSSIVNLLELVQNIDSFDEKFNLMYSNSLNISFTIYENLHIIPENIDIKILILKNVLECDQYNTFYFDNKNIDCINFVTSSCIKILSLFNRFDKKNIVATKIWSLYSNKCSKQLKFYNMYRLHKNLMFSLKNIIYISYLLNTFIINDNIDELIEMKNIYNIENIQQFQNIIKIYKDDVKINKSIKNIYKK